MAEESSEGITMELAQQENQSYKRDKNGEEILFEGEPVPFHCSVCFVILIILSPLLTILMYLAAREWRLYLTPSGIKYRPITLCCCGCQDDYCHFSLDGIEDVLYAPYQNMVILCMKPTKTKTLCGYTYNSEYHYIPNVNNDKEFYQAVRRVMAARKREA